MDNNFYGPLKAVIFDMDNTFFDFVEAKLKACAQILNYLEKEGNSVSEDAESLFRYFLRDSYGFESHENLRDFLQDNALFTAKYYKICRLIYEREKLESLKLYPGVKPTFEVLKKTDLKLAVLTDADKKHTLARLKKVELQNYFDEIVSFDMTGRKKPDLYPFRFLLRKLGVEAKAALFVGDSLRRDINPAKKLGFKTVYAAYGDRNFHENEKPEHKGDFQLQTFPEILSCIAALNSVSSPVSSPSSPRSPSRNSCPTSQSNITEFIRKV
ncbi:MAG: HAD family hydrolase [Methanosarcinaceae archaeon]|nr:HAD family hydrolase [Methanosarcinaceae archaeon]